MVPGQERAEIYQREAAVYVLLFVARRRRTAGTDDQPWRGPAHGAYCDFRGLARSGGPVGRGNENRGSCHCQQPESDRRWLLRSGGDRQRRQSRGDYCVDLGSTRRLFFQFILLPPQSSNTGWRLAMRGSIRHVRVIVIVSAALLAARVVVARRGSGSASVALK